MNTRNDSGEQFRAEDLEALLENGHELASHTFSHISSRSVSCATFREEVEKGKKAIEELAGSANFAYPFGHVTLQTKRALAAGLTSARSIIPGFNGPDLDLNLLRANSLYGDIESTLHAEELIAENCKRRTWLIFYTHDVQKNPSPFGCTPTLLESVVECAARGSCRILPVREALAEGGIQNGNAEGHVRPYAHA
jgi:peptidoglycan/xylan/chitin deacetylase (PgdA/CDA1 family)